MRQVPPLETHRLRIRTFALEDAAAYQRISDLCFGDGSQVGDASAINTTREMMHWLLLADRWLHNQTAAAVWRPCHCAEGDGRPDRRGGAGALPDAVRATAQLWRQPQRAAHDRDGVVLGG